MTEENLLAQIHQMDLDDLSRVLLAVYGRLFVMLGRAEATNITQIVNVLSVAEIAHRNTKETAQGFLGLIEEIEKLAPPDPPA